MLTIREIEYTTEKKPEELLSTLKWSVERVDSLFGQLLTNLTTDTSKHWIGTINEEKLKFSLITPSTILNPKFFQVILSASIGQAGPESHINLKVQLGWHTAITFIFIYAVTLLNLFLWISSDQQPEGLTGVIIFLLIFPGIGSLILFRKIKKMERKFEQLLELN